MQVKHVTALVTMIVTVCFSLYAKHADNYLLGNFSYLRAHNDYLPRVDSLSNRMQQAGYNATVCEIVDSSTDSQIAQLLDTFDGYGIDAILTDKVWLEGSTTPTYGTEALSIGNYWRFEAEYDSTTSFNNNIDKYFCINSLTTGYAQPRAFSSGNYVLKLINNQPGYGLNKLEYRWPSPLISNSRYNVGPEFRFIQRSYGTNGLDDFEANPCNDDILYVTIAFKCTDLPSIDNSLEIMHLSFNGYPSQDAINTNNVAHYNQLTGQTGLTSTVTIGDYNSLPLISGANVWEHKELTLQIAVRDLYNANLIEHKRGWRYSLTNLNPRLEWLGIGSIEIDYVDFEDTMHRNLKYNTALRDSVCERIQYLANDYDNIKYLYLSDEPTQGQFNQFNEIEHNLFTGLNELPSSVSGVITCSWMYHRDVVKGNNDIYDHISLQSDAYSPDITMFDIYPLFGSIRWNHSGYEPGISRGLQKTLENDMLKYYKRYKTLCMNTGSKFVPVPQSTGVWDSSLNKWGSLRPPHYTQKFLQLLPLCYGADGIVNFKLYDVVPNGNIKQEYSPINVSPSNSPVSLSFNSNWQGLIEANAKIIKYSEYMNPNEWIDADVINTSGYANPPFLPSIYLDSLYVRPQSLTQNGIDLYDGFIQCGLFVNGATDPYFMIVNRRAEYVSMIPSPPRDEPDNLVNTLPCDLDHSFVLSPSQVVRFSVANTANNLYGSYIGFYDPFDESFYNASNNSGVDVEINAGDGKLLQMCATLPIEVTTNSVIKKKGILEGDIEINAGVEVNVLAGTELTIKKNSSITVLSGASLILRGSVTIEDKAIIRVLEGGSLSICDAICTWGQGSFIEVNGGSLSIDSSSLDRSSNVTRWKGLRVTNSNLVTISDATISNAEYHQVINSNLLISNSSFIIPANSWGLLLKNSITGYQTEIINTEPGRGFYGTSNLTSKGIYLYTMKNPAYISNVDFQNLNYGIFKSAIPYATDSVSECNFVNCDTGIRLCNNENGTDIQQCSFANNQTGKQGTGIQLVASSPTISTSNFTNLYRGILTEFALISGIGIESSVTESNFYNCEMGMESRSSNQRLKANYFNRNNSGIVNHAGSNLNLSYDANNVLMNHNDNIVFYDTMPYESTIQLFTGHNDFYHLTDNSTSISAIDFSFDTNYYNFPITPDFKINASKNWFQDDQVTFNNPAYVDYVYVDLYDPSPTMPAPPPENDRLFIALGYESQELYELACATYQAIIDDQLEEEQTYVTSAIDGLYRCTKMIPNPAWELTDYFDTKALQYAIDDPTLSAILKDYLAKVFVLNKDFQSAVDLIQLRIDNPISEIDSLRAVLDLEIVLQLAAMEEDKRPLTTKYAQYQYPDIQVFDVMHSNNWDKYNRALRQNDQETNSVIAPTPQIQSNYPNPFNPSTTIAFSIPETGRVRVSVYNIKGQKVKDLLNTEMTRGTHSLVWDGKDANSRNVASGIYFIKLESGGKTSIRKAMLMK